MFLNGDINLKNEENEKFSPQTTFQIQEPAAMLCQRWLMRRPASMPAARPCLVYAFYVGSMCLLCAFYVGSISLQGGRVLSLNRHGRRTLSILKV